MPMTERERMRQRFVKLLTDHNLTTDAAAALLHSSPSRVKSWRMEETSKGSNPVPQWAVELLELKLKQAAR